MTTTELSKILGNPRNKACEEYAIDYILIDSRNCIYADKSIFFALTSKTGNGHKYVDELLGQGVKNFVVSQYNEAWNNQDANFWVVENTLSALQFLVGEHRKQFDIPVIGITGSNGKTIVKEWLYALLQPYYRCIRSPKSFNSQIGVPLSVWQMRPEHQLGIFEAGISTILEMQHIAPIISPTIGIFTNLGTAHQEGFESTQQKLYEKLQLFTHAQTLVYCKEYPIESLAAQLLPNTQLVSWNYDDPSATINVHIEAQTTTQTKLWVQPKNIAPNHQITASSHHPSEAHCYTLPFADKASLENAINVLVTCMLLGHSDVDTQLLHPVSMRLSIKQGLNNCLLIDDAYTADLEGLHVALSMLSAQAAGKTIGRTVILSDMLQTGMNDEDLYLAVSSLLKEKKIDTLIGIGNVLPKFGHLFPMQTQFYATTQQFLDTHPSFQNQIILIKGARMFQLEQITAYLEQKRHETVMEINLNALVHNFKHLRSFLQPETKTVAMIKANAYGCGAVTIAQTLSHFHCDYFGVAVADEGVELRKAGIRTPIIVMNPEPSSFNLLLDNNLEPEIYSFAELQRFMAFADKQGVTHYPIHLKFDTGMHRLGFEKKDLPLLISILKHTNVIKVASAFSHLAAAEDPAMDAFTKNQIDLFEDCTSTLQKALPYSFLRHILNTSGIQRFPLHQYEMVRMGIGLYGVGIDDASPIQNVATLKTVILQIKELKQGETIGYNRKGVLLRDSKVAAIPIGYADGLDRAFGGGNGFALVRGQKAPFLGNICMDVCMIDVTDIEDVSENDTVTIFGDELTISLLAEKTNTIPYEILTGVSARVKRVYYQE